MENGVPPSPSAMAGQVGTEVKGAVAKPESFATDFFYLFQLNAIKITKKNPIYVLNIGYFSNGMFEK